MARIILFPFLCTECVFFFLAAVICNAAGGKTSKDVRERLEGILGKIMQVTWSTGANDRKPEQPAQPSVRCPLREGTGRLHSPFPPVF